MKILLAQINPVVGDLEGNSSRMLQCVENAKRSKVDLLIFPELSLTGYPPEDFLLLPHFVNSVQEHLEKIVAASKGLSVVVGTIRKSGKGAEKALHNSAAIIVDGKLIGFQDKTLLPTYDVFDERRYFESASERKLWDICGKKVAVTICEDIWQHSEMLKSVSYCCDPILDLQKLKPELLINISASPYHFGKPASRFQVGVKAATTLHCPVVLCNQVGGNDSLIFDGYSFAVNGSGKVNAIAKGFEEDLFVVDPFSAQEVQIKIDDTEDLYRALVLGVRDYFVKSGFHSACLGLSGGVDSALVACIAADALGEENVTAVCMPSRFTSKESLEDAKKLAENLGIDYREIPIEAPFESFLELLHPQFDDLPHDATEENLQARIRGMILMALSNKFGFVVLSTGNKSELAMGYATLYGDMCGGLGVISDLTKEQVYLLAKWINRERELIPERILTKAPSAELRFNQKDSDSLPPYEIVDNVLREYVEEHCAAEVIAKKFGYDVELVRDLVKRIHRNEYKRRQSPPGLRISEKAFSVGRRFPIVQKWV